MTDQQSKKAESLSQADLAMQKRRGSLRWWIGTVVLTLFPTLATILIAALRGHPPLSWNLVFKDGEIILASFLIVTSTSISAYTVKKETVFTDAVRYILKFLSLFQLIAYTAVKTSAKTNPITLIVVSVAALIVSVCFSWIWYKLTSKEE
ncbi:MAG: hypothetical protein K2O84_11180 [Oscillospiraceae bacterium]|nr:hypothetical protein [Oscillospiraceae bacterium]